MHKAMPRVFEGSMGLLILGALSGCPRMAHFTVTHPALLNVVPFGNTMTVGNVEGPPPAAMDVRADLEQRITTSLNPSIHLVPQGGVVIGGYVPVYAYNESIRRDDRTCTRQVNAGTDGQGHILYRTQSYTCSEHV